ncbi:MAG TPA: hypothetical protein VMH28_11785 [Candidatus Acidoferrales bacterium]|nr:hypothetical protein [Candidatus Acidoferrales bacterium]
MYRIASRDDLSRRQDAVTLARKQLAASFLHNSMVERSAWRYVGSLRRYRRTLEALIREAA